MAERAYTNVGIWSGGYDLSGYLRGTDLQYGAEMLDRTTFADLTRNFYPGLKVVRARVEGLWDGDVEPQFATNIGVSDVPFSIAPTNTVGDVAYTFLAGKATYEPGGPIGEMLAFNATAEATGSPLVRGKLMLDSSGLASSSASTKINVGAIAAGHTLYAALHVIAAGTGTFDGVLQSDADASAGGESNRITFTQATGVTSEWKTLDGPVTDEYWRLSYTIAGAAPSFTVALIVGIL